MWRVCLRWSRSSSERGTTACSDPLVWLPLWKSRLKRWVDHQFAPRMTRAALEPGPTARKCAATFLRRGCDAWYHRQCRQSSSSVDRPLSLCDARLHHPQASSGAQVVHRWSRPAVCRLCPLFENRVPATTGFPTFETFPASHSRFRLALFVKQAALQPVPVLRRWTHRRFRHHRTAGLSLDQQTWIRARCAVVRVRRRRNATPSLRCRTVRAAESRPSSTCFQRWNRGPLIRAAENSSATNPRRSKARPTMQTARPRARCSNGGETRCRAHHLAYLLWFPSRKRAVRASGRTTNQSTHWALR